MNHVVTVIVREGEKQYVAQCVEIPVVTQAATLDGVISNIREAVSLHLEDESLEELGFDARPHLLIVFETGLADAA